MSVTASPELRPLPSESRHSPARSAPTRHRARTWLRRHAFSIVLLVAVLAPIALVYATGMTDNPIRHDDEGTYVSQAWAFGDDARLSHYTYWYDHPPVGWMKLAVYDRLTGATARAEHAVAAQREATVVLHLVASVLLFVLCRRLGFARGWSLLAVALFSLSPLAIIYHRMVFLDNLAMPWLLGSFVLAASPQRRLSAFAGSAVCFALAVLTKETMLLALPALLYAVWQNTAPSNRRYTWTVFGSLLVFTGLLYPLFAALQGELFPGPDHVSLWEAIRFHLVDRGAPEGLAAVQAWTALDRHLLILGGLAAVPALLRRRLRPFVALTVIYVAVMFRPDGFLPEPYVVIFLPPAALFVAGVFDGVWRWQPLREGRHVLLRTRFANRVPAAIAVVAALALAGVLAVAWAPGVGQAMHDDQDEPKRLAQQWVIANIDRDQRLLIENTTWVDFVRAGWAEEDLLWFYKLGLDPASEDIFPRGYRDLDYIVGTGLIPTMAEMLDVEDLRLAMENSTVVAAWGEGNQRVEVRRIHDDAPAVSETGTGSEEHLTTIGGTP